jgi:hypothetical protein
MTQLRACRRQDASGSYRRCPLYFHTFDSQDNRSASLMIHLTAAVASVLFAILDKIICGFLGFRFAARNNPLKIRAIACFGRSLLGPVYKLVDARLGF